MTLKSSTETLTASPFLKSSNLTCFFMIGWSKSGFFTLFDMSWFCSFSCIGRSINVSRTCCSTGSIAWGSVIKIKRNRDGVLIFICFISSFISWILFNKSVMWLSLFFFFYFSIFLPTFDICFDLIYVMVEIVFNWANSWWKSINIFENFIVSWVVGCLEFFLLFFNCVHSHIYAN